MTLRAESAHLAVLVKEQFHQIRAGLASDTRDCLRTRWSDFWATLVERNRQDVFRRNWLLRNEHHNATGETRRSVRSLRTRSSKRCVPEHIRVLAFVLKKLNDVGRQTQQTTIDFTSMVGSAKSQRQIQRYGLHNCTIELRAVQLNMPAAGAHQVRKHKNSRVVRVVDTVNGPLCRLLDRQGRAA